MKGFDKKLKKCVATFIVILPLCTVRTLTKIDNNLHHLSQETLCTFIYIYESIRLYMYLIPDVHQSEIITTRIALKFGSQEKLLLLNISLTNILYPSFCWLKRIFLEICILHTTNYFFCIPFYVNVTCIDMLHLNKITLSRFTAG